MVVLHSDLPWYNPQKITSIKSKYVKLTLLQTNSKFTSEKKGPSCPKRKFIFQPPTFCKGELSVSGSLPFTFMNSSGHDVSFTGNDFLEFSIQNFTENVQAKPILNIGTLCFEEHLVSPPFPMQQITICTQPFRANEKK